MAALAYLGLPVTGALALLLSGSARTRAHALQAIAIGTAWPLLLYAASVLARTLTWVVAVAGACMWLIFLIGTALGRDPKLPVLGDLFFGLYQEESLNEG